MENLENEVQKDVEKFLDDYGQPSIDNPPKEPKQESFIKEEDKIDPGSFVPKCDCTSALKLKVSGEVYSVPILNGKFARDTIKEMLLVTINSQKFNDVLNAITGHKPEEKHEQQEIEAEKEEENKVSTEEAKAEPVSGEEQEAETSDPEIGNPEDRYPVGFADSESGDMF